MKRYRSVAVPIFFIVVCLDFFGQSPGGEEPVPPDSTRKPSTVYLNSVSYFPIGNLFGTVSAAYERTINSLLGLELSVFYHTPIFGFSPGTVAPGVFFEWYGIGLSALIYPGRSISDGLFIAGGLEAGYLTPSADYSVVTFEPAGTTTLELSLAAGYKFRFGRFTVSPRVWWSYIFPLGADRSEVLLNAVNLTGDFALSWNF